LRSFRFVATFWGSLSILHAIFFVWNSRAVDEIEEVDIFETWPGFGILLLRLVQAVWFLVEIKRSIDGELDEEKAEFLTHFGAGFLVWFVHLPMLGVVASKIELLWRFKIILGINLLANTLASAILVHLFWPMSTNRRFFAADDRMHRLLNHSEEMDEFEKSLIDEEFVPSDPAVEDDDLCPVFTPTSL
uniref:GPR180/TMEM145 transmembrane domain-containing protein n=1 Tax=Plectus sambesii TaxID=2011161 RepID=A0A914VYP3_9BILA